MLVPGLGEINRFDESDFYYSRPIAISMFGGKVCRIGLEGYAGDDCKEDFHEAIANFLSWTTEDLHQADVPLFRYYKDFEQHWIESGGKPIETHELWTHVQMGSETIIQRRPLDKCIYVSINGSCDWEEEHGLQIVLKQGSAITKLGGYDGHLTNSDAYGDESLEPVICVSQSST